MIINRKSRRVPSYLAGAVIGLAGLAHTAFADVPLAGTAIGNQASATYTDDSNTQRSATSNTVVTIVSQIPGIDLTADNTRTVAPGGSVFFPHTLTNTGNGTDSYSLTNLTNAAAGDDFDLTGLAIYPDENQDGLPDNFTAITTTGDVAAGESFFFVIGGVVPGGQTDGQTAIVNIVASSNQSGGALTDSNTDTANVSGDAVITFTKAIDTASGKPGDTDVTYTLTYTNTGNTTATDVTLEDTIPSGLVYQANSGRWSVTGTTTLTDSNDGNQGTAPNQIDYQFAAGKLTAVISNVQAGQSGSITFKVDVGDPEKPRVVDNVAKYSYDPDGPGGDGPDGPFDTNKVPFEILQVPSLTLGGDVKTVNAEAGSTVTFSNLLTNTGNGTDTFDITYVTDSFPTGTTFKFFQNDGQTPMVDTNGNGIPDTGPVLGAIDAPNNTYNVTVKATLPTTLPAGAATTVFPLTKRATSSVNDPDSGTPPQADAVDSIPGINPPSVDITNDTADGPGDGSTGNTLIQTKTTDPGTTAEFTLVIENEGAISDSYDLSATNIPAGWMVVFRNPTTGELLTNTGVLQPGQARTVTAEVIVPENEDPGNNDITFTSASPTSDATDSIVDRVTVNTVRELSIESDNAGQIFPGGSIVYSHVITNLGNVAEGNVSNPITLGLVDTQASSGWTSVVYLDNNNDGTLDSSDPIITQFPGGSTTSIPKTESKRVFVKVFAPLGAPNNAINVSTITATATGTINTVAAPAAVSNEDTTTVIIGDLVLLKEQAPDTGNDGNADSAYTALNLNLEPGQSILYKITVTNSGSADATNVIVFDKTPTNTTYDDNGNSSTAAVSGGTVNTVDSAPTSGNSGEFEFNVGTLAPGESATILFGVTIDE